MLQNNASWQKRPDYAIVTANKEGADYGNCWSHLRRYFVDALPKGISESDTTIPAQAIGYINRLFELEKNLKVLSAEGRKEQRLIQETPVLEAFWSWVEGAAVGILPKSKLDIYGMLLIE